MRVCKIALNKGDYMLENPKSLHYYSGENMKDELPVKTDNQQVTPQYIAGIWDGEGTITITIIRCKKWTQYRAFVSVSNTDLRIINAVKDYAKSLNCGVYICERTSKNKNRKLQYQLSITTLRSKLDFLNSILPFLIAKREQAILAIQFVERRLSKINLNRRDRLGHYIGREKFDDYEADLHQKIKYFNVRGTSETLCHPSNEEDKVRSALKNAEQVRNDFARQEKLFS